MGGTGETGTGRQGGEEAVVTAVVVEDSTPTEEGCIFKVMCANGRE